MESSSFLTSSFAGLPQITIEGTVTQSTKKIKWSDGKANAFTYISRNGLGKFYALLHHICVLFGVCH